MRKFTEKYGSPFLAAKTRPNADAAELSLIDKMLAAIKKAGWMRIPQGTDLQFLEASGKGASADVYEKLLKYIREDIALEVLGHTGAAISTAGKLGGEDNALKVREDIADLDCSIIAGLFNELIKRIVSLNFGDVVCPKFTFLPKEDFQKELASRDKMIYDMGIDIDPEYFAQKYSIPIEFLSKRERQIEFSGAKIAEFAETDERDHGDAPDYFGFDSIVEQVENIVNESEDFEECRQRILDEFSHLDNEKLSQGIVPKVLQNAMIFSELKGISVKRR